MKIDLFFFEGLNKLFLRVPQEDIEDGKRAVYQLNPVQEEETEENIKTTNKRKLEEVGSTTTNSSKKLKLE